MTEGQVHPPFFIIGAQRSGTTMLRLMMNAHPDICVPFESVFISEFYGRLGEYGPLHVASNVEKLLDDIRQHDFVIRGNLIPSPDAVLALKPRSYAALVDAVFTCLAADEGKQRWGDKTPSYVTEIDVLNQLFPACRVIHLVRDGRDVALSLRRVSWGSANLPAVARDWRWRTFVAHKTGRMLGSRFLEVRYEDLVEAPASTPRHICSHVGVEFHPDMLEYSSGASAAMPSASMEWHKNSVQAPMKDKAGAWANEMSKADQVIFGREAAASLALFDYPPTPKIESVVDRLHERTRRIRYAFFGRA